MKIFKDSIKAIIISFASLVLMGVAYAWTEPGSSPPTGNTSAPIVTSSAASPVNQTKYGNLTLRQSSTTGIVTAYGPSAGQFSASALQLAATDSSNYWHLGFRGAASGGDLNSLSTWYYNGASWISPLKLFPTGDAVFPYNVSVSGKVNACKKVSYTYSGLGTGQTTYCGANYYVVAVLDGSGVLQNPYPPPSSGSLICCKNAD